ncbi:MAG: hypothetical protein L0H78_16155 [Humibacillus sp.]|nr:hypothetical protein [Humibacillus sp.]
MGKTTLLRALSQIFTGNVDLLKDRGLEDCQPDATSVLVLQIRCSREMLDRDALSRAILDRMTDVLGRNYASPRIHLKGFEVETSLSIVKLKAAWDITPTSPQSPSAELRERLSSVCRSQGGDVMLLLDECEQLPWILELLDYTRSFDDVKVRFVLALRDYASYMLADPSHGDYRWQRRVNLSSLSRLEIEGLFARASSELRKLGVVWSLSIEAVNYIQKSSAGEPWYLQMVGSELLLDEDLALEQYVNAPVTKGNKSVRVSLDMVRQAEARMVVSSLHNLHAERYLRICRKAPKTEEMLRALAHFPGTYIPNRYIEHVRERRIASAGGILRRLSNPDLGPVLTRPTSPTGTWQFEDHQFRVYCRLASATNDLIAEMGREHAESWNA